MVNEDGHRYVFNDDGTLNAAADGLPSVIEATPPAPNSSDDYIVSATNFASF